MKRQKYDPLRDIQIVSKGQTFYAYYYPNDSLFCAVIAFNAIMQNSNTFYDSNSYIRL